MVTTIIFIGTLVLMLLIFYSRIQKTSEEEQGIKESKEEPIIYDTVSERRMTVEEFLRTSHFEREDPDRVIPEEEIERYFQPEKKEAAYINNFLLESNIDYPSEEVGKHVMEKVFQCNFVKYKYLDFDVAFLGEISENRLLALVNVAIEKHSPRGKCIDRETHLMGIFLHNSEQNDFINVVEPLMQDLNACFGQSYLREVSGNCFIFKLIQSATFADAKKIVRLLKEFGLLVK